MKVEAAINSCRDILNQLQHFPRWNRIVVNMAEYTTATLAMRDQEERFENYCPLFNEMLGDIRSELEKTDVLYFKTLAERETALVGRYAEMQNAMCTEAPRISAINQIEELDAKDIPVVQKVVLNRADSEALVATLHRNTSFLLDEASSFLRGNVSLDLDPVDEHKVSAYQKIIALCQSNFSLL